LDVVIYEKAACEEKVWGKSGDGINAVLFI